MDHDQAIAQLSQQINVVLRLAAAAYDQTALLRRGLMILTESATPLCDEREARLRALIQDIQGMEQESFHAIALMMAATPGQHAGPGRETRNPPVG